MTTEEYDQLLREIGEAREFLRQAIVTATVREQNLAGLLRLLSLEDARIVRTALSQPEPDESTLSTAGSD